MNHVKILALASLLAIVGSAAATNEHTLNVYDFPQLNSCSDNGMEFLEAIQDGWGEKMFFTSDTNTFTVDEESGSTISLQGKVMFLLNQENATFTLLVLYPWGSVCEIISGENFEPYIGERR